MMAARAATTRREWAIAVVGGLALAAGLLWLLRGPAGPEAPVAATAAPPATPGPAPVPVPMPAPASSPTDLALAGLRTGPDGGMAIVVADGRQHLLRPGRALPGGLRLLRIEAGRAILDGPGGEQVLAFPDTAQPASAPPRAAGADPTPWRLALAPERSARGLDGWRLNSLSGLPLLARAGLRPGDILLAANGAELVSEEKIMELPQELAANGQLLLRVRRAGQVTEITVKP